MQACLDREGETAASMGYDRPSPKLMGFLRKHYGELLLSLIGSAWQSGRGTCHPRIASCKVQKQGLLVQSNSCARTVMQFPPLLPPLGQPPPRSACCQSCSSSVCL